MYYNHLNPFGFLVESLAYPFARIIRSGFRQRFRDGYRTFSGILLEESGIVDFLMLQIPNLLAQATRFMAKVFSLVTGIGDKSDSSDPHVWLRTAVPWLLLLPAAIILGALTLAMAVVTAPFLVAKFILSTALTLVTSPLMALAHVLTFPWRYSAEKAVNTLTVTAPYRGKLGRPAPLNLTEKFKNLVSAKPEDNSEPDKQADVPYERIVKPYYRNGSQEDLAVKPGYYKGEFALALFTSAKDMKREIKEHKIPKPRGYIMLTDKNLVGIKGLLRLNLFNTASHCEEDAGLKQVEDRLAAGILNPKPSNVASEPRKDKGLKLPKHLDLRRSPA